MPPKKSKSKSKSKAKKPYDKDQLYDVERITKTRDQEVLRDGVYVTEPYYYVKWKGYPACKNSWEPKSNLMPNCESLIKDFYKKHPYVLANNIFPKRKSGQQKTGETSSKKQKKQKSGAAGEGEGEEEDEDEEEEEKPDDDEAEDDKREESGSDDESGYNPQNSPNDDFNPNEDRENQSQRVVCY